MARPLRIEFPGAIYHITSRGNARQAIFKGNPDRFGFLRVLGDVVSRFNWLCHAYCLMGNHYHLLIETIDGNLSQGMRHLNGVYTQAFNRRHERVGHVLQGRYKSIIIDRDNYLLEVCRYVVLNPVRAGIVENPRKYVWSSYKATAGYVKPPSLLTVDWILGHYGKKRQEARKRYKDFVHAGIDAPSIWDELKAQCILGSKEFVDRLRPAARDKEEIKEIPKVQRLAFRPVIEKIISSEKTRNREERNKAIEKAYFDYGYTQSEIARQLDLHYGTISRIIKQSIS